MPKVTQIRLGLSNAYLVTDRKSILVDTGSPGEADRILNAIQKAGVAPRDLSLILHTHGHVDHAGSTAGLKRRLGMPVAVHSSDAFMLRTGTNGEIRPRNFEAKLVKAMVIKPFAPSEPDILIEEEMDLNDFGVNGRILFTPGHTRGSVSLLLENREAIIGDVMMGGWLGGAVRGSHPNYHYFIDDLNNLHASMKKIIACRPNTLYVGHGGPLAHADVIKQFSSFSGN